MFDSPGKANVMFRARIQEFNRKIHSYLKATDKVADLLIYYGFYCSSSSRCRQKSFMVKNLLESYCRDGGSNVLKKCSTWYVFPYNTFRVLPYLDTSL